MKGANYVFAGLIAISILAGIFAYPYLPGRFASHWNMLGEADGDMPKFWGVFLVPLIMAGLFGIYNLILRIDPLRHNIAAMRKYYDWFWFALFIFLLYIFGLILSWNFGYRFNFTLFILPALAALWYVLGVILPHIKRNWFFGIRTPWTLSSDAVWERTHIFAGRLFRIAAEVTFVAFFFVGYEYMFIVAIGAVALSALVALVYSFIIYRKMNGGIL